MIEDDEQLSPTVISVSGQLSYNEHTATLSNALFTRLRHAQFPTIQLKEQNRMHEVLAEWPGLRPVSLSLHTIESAERRSFFLSETYIRPNNVPVRSVLGS